MDANGGLEGARINLLVWRWCMVVVHTKHKHMHKMHELMHDARPQYLLRFFGPLPEQLPFSGSLPHSCFCNRVNSSAFHAMAAPHALTEAPSHTL